MKLLRPIVLAFSVFSRIPVPEVAWDEENMRYMICALPLVGAAIGLCLWLWAWLGRLLGFGLFLQAAGFTLLPVAVTGGIHLDGFGDTLDALASHAEPERKREILKDPRCGTFAVIGVTAYLLLYFALCTELSFDTGTLLLLGLMHILSRAWCALSVVCFPASSGKGLLKTLKAPADGKEAAVLLCGLLALCAGAMLLLNWRAGAVMSIVSLGCALYVLTMSRRQFGGMSGDLAGYLLQLGELSMLAALVLICKVG
ncbi:MAG: adenosylcobinamide-GDP ribazoletransferase [Dethiobacteria bacterium]